MLTEETNESLNNQTDASERYILPANTETMDEPKPKKERKPRTAKAEGGKVKDIAKSDNAASSNTVYFLVTERDGALPQVVTEEDGRVAAAQTIVSQQQGMKTVLFRGTAIEPDDVFRGKK